MKRGAVGDHSRLRLIRRRRAFAGLTLDKGTEQLSLLPVGLGYRSRHRMRAHRFRDIRGVWGLRLGGPTRDQRRYEGCEKASHRELKLRQTTGYTLRRAGK